MPNHWQNIGQSLATACLRNANEVSPTHAHWDGLALDREWVRKLLLFDQVNYLEREATLVPVLDRLRAIDAPNLDVPILLAELLHLVIRHFTYLAALNIQILVDWDLLLGHFRSDVLFGLSLSLLLLFSIHGVNGVIFLLFLVVLLFIDLEIILILQSLEVFKSNDVSGSRFYFELILSNCLGLYFIHERI